MFKKLLTKWNSYLSEEDHVNLSSVLLIEMERWLQYNRDLIRFSVDCSEEASALHSQYHSLRRIGLENSKNAKILERKINELSQQLRDTNKAHELIRFVKAARTHFGEETLLVSNEAFAKVCRKYDLTEGMLKQYTGIIPNQNLLKIADVVGKVPTFGEMRILNQDNSITFLL